MLQSRHDFFIINYINHDIINNKLMPIAWHQITQTRLAAVSTAWLAAGTLVWLRLSVQA